MPITRENVNVFCSDLITVVPKWNYFIFMQIDYPRWLPGTVTKNSITRKRQYLKTHWLKLCQNVSCMNPLYFFAVWDSKMAAVTKNSALHENDNSSITA